MSDIAAAALEAERDAYDRRQDSLERARRAHGLDTDDEQLDFLIAPDPEFDAAVDAYMAERRAQAESAERIYERFARAWAAVFELTIRRDFAGEHSSMRAAYDRRRRARRRRSRR